MFPSGANAVPLPLMAVCSSLNWSAAHPSHVAFCNRASKKYGRVDAALAETDAFRPVQRERLEVRRSGSPGGVQDVVVEGEKVFIQVIDEVDTPEGVCRC